MRALFVALLVCAGALIAAPIANAETECVVAGHTPEECDGLYVRSVASALTEYDPATAIATGHKIVDHLVARIAVSPANAKPAFVGAVNALLRGRADEGFSMTADEAVFVAKMAVRFYGPPGLEDQVDAALAQG